MRTPDRVALRAAAVWLLLMAAEVVHGTVRTLWVAPHVGDFRATRSAAPPHRGRQRDDRAGRGRLA